MPTTKLSWRPLHLDRSSRSPGPRPSHKQEAEYPTADDLKISKMQCCPQKMGSIVNTCKCTVQWCFPNSCLPMNWVNWVTIYSKNPEEGCASKKPEKVSARPLVLATLLFRTLHCSSANVFSPTFRSWNINKTLCQRLWPATTKVWRISAVVKFVQLVALWELSARLSCLAWPPADIVLNPGKRRDDLHTI